MQNMRQARWLAQATLLLGGDCTMQEIKVKQESSAQSRAVRNSDTTFVRKQLARYVACVFEPGDMVEVRRLPCGRGLLDVYNLSREISRHVGMVGLVQD